MVKEYLTIAELAKKADIPNSTCRRYLNTFEAFFMVKGGNRLKKYEEQAVDVLRRIKGLYDEGLESSEIHNVLVNEFPLVIDGDEQQETNEVSSIPTLATVEDIESIHQKLSKLDMLDDISRELEKVKEVNKMLVERMEQQQDFIKQSMERRDQRIIESIQSMQEQKQAQIEEVAAAEQEVKQQKRGFLSKIFRIN